MFALETLKAKLIGAAVVFLLGVTITGIAGYKIHTWRVAALKAEWAKEEAAAVETAKAEVKKVCDENNKTTKETARALHSRLDIVNRNYDSLLKYAAGGARPSAAAGDTRGADGATGADLPVVCLPRPDGFTAGRLNDVQAATLIGIQDFLASIYRTNGQEELLPEEYRVK